MEQAIRTEYGLITGITRDGCREYLGVPFAKAPVGDLAFRHPVKHDKWDGVLKCDRASANPIQGSSPRRQKFTSQDCLYLNVFVPDRDSADKVNVAPINDVGETGAPAVDGVQILNASSSEVSSPPGNKPLPVMVWVFGGSYNTGGIGRVAKDSDELVFDLSRVAKDANAIVVQFNYRLNIYGFMNLHFLDERFDMNCGMMDQVMALKFIKDNIAAFGGDPDNITLFGQSAGAACILALMEMPEASPLFNRAILESACVDSFWTEEESEKFTKRFLARLGIPLSQPRRIMDADPLLIYEANHKLKGTLLREGEVRCAFSPVIDGVIIPRAPRDAIIAAASAPASTPAKEGAPLIAKPVIMGYNQHEGNLFTNSMPWFVVPFAALACKINVGIGPGQRRKLSDGLTHGIYRDPVIDIASSYSSDFYVYEYQYQTPQIRAEGRGCFHASELPVLTGIDSVFSKVGDEESERVGLEMRTLWGKFAHGVEAPWKPYADGGEIKYFR